MEDILPQEAKIDKSANCLAGHGWAGLKMNKYPWSTGGYGLDVAGYGWVVWAWKILDHAISSVAYLATRNAKALSGHTIENVEDGDLQMFL